MSILGINGLGRIGKLTLWYHILRDHFDGFVINTGRDVGTSLDDIVQLLGTDSTYGPIERFLFGIKAKKEIKVKDRQKRIIEVYGKPVTILNKFRNPREIEWYQENVKIVVDTTGVFNDPTQPTDHPSGSLRGHLESGAQKVILSAPFKIKDKSKKIPNDSIMLLYGINHTNFDPSQHHIISSASCTTTGLAHMIKPLLECKETSNILTASLSTIHAATNTQSVLDTVPKASATDLRKNRSVFNNIILSSTGAARALEKVLPQISHIGFMADSVRIPTSTVSMINLNITFHSPVDSKKEPIISHTFINDLYKRASETDQKDLLLYSESQNVSSDILGVMASIVIEGNLNHTRTGFIEFNNEILSASGITADEPIRIPVTHAKIFGWYDNEFGSFVYTKGNLTCYIDEILS